MTYAEKLALAIKFNQRIKAGNAVNQISIDKMLLSTEIKPDDLKTMTALYDEYKVSKSYLIGNIFQYTGKLYKVVQAHTSQADWKPDTLPALYTPMIPENVLPAWKQPTGAQDAYKIGDKVIYKTKTYQSLINANTWSPEAYPAGWKLI